MEKLTANALFARKGTHRATQRALRARGLVREAKNSYFSYLQMRYRLESSDSQLNLQFIH